jgi:chitodextrinase
VTSHRAGGAARSVVVRLSSRLHRLSALLVIGIVVVGASTAAAQGRDRTPPTTPTNLRVTATTPYSVTLAWNPSTDNSGKFSYVICCGGTTQASVPQTATSFTYTAGMEAGRSFTFRIYAVDAAGNYSKPSNSVTVRLPSDTVPPATPAVAVTEVGPTHIALSFRSTDNGPHVWYWITMNGQTIVAGNNTGTATIAPLQPEAAYTFTVRARDFAANWSAESAPLTVTTKPRNPNDHTPPTTPTNLRETHWDDGETELRWDQSTDDFDPQSILEYRVHVNGVLQDVAVGRGRSIVYIEVGILNTVTVTAVDTAGNESAPATITIQM